MSEFRKQSLGERWSSLQPSKTLLVWSCVGSVAAALVVGFVWGGWVTGATARSMATTAGEQGRQELASVICVEKFMGAPDAQVQLVALQSVSGAYQQRQFIEAGDWAVMPDNDKATRQAAELCAKVLASLAPEAATPAPDAAAAPAPTAQ